VYAEVTYSGIGCVGKGTVLHCNSTYLLARTILRNHALWDNEVCLILCCSSF